MKNAYKIIFIIVSLVIFTACSSHKNKSAQMGWQLGIQSNSFHDSTFLQSVRKVKKLGLHYIEAFPGQKIGGGLKGKMSYAMSTTDREKIKKFLKANDVNLIAYGVLAPRKQKKWNQIFDFAKSMGIEIIAAKPIKSQLSYISHLCDMYGINIAIQNQTKPSRYWNPEILRKTLNGLSPRIGACADVGNWVRSGLNPQKSIKKLKNHITEVQLEDLSSIGSQARDTVLGKGVVHIPQLLKQLYKQGYQGFIAIKYNSNTVNGDKGIKSSVNYIETVLAKL